MLAGTACGAGGEGKAFVFVVDKQVSLAKRIMERNKKGHPLVPSAYEVESMCYRILCQLFPATNTTVCLFSKRRSLIYVIHVHNVTSITSTSLENTSAIQMFFVHFYISCYIWLVNSRMEYS